MVTEVRSLLVTTDMDVSGYTSAARQKTAADTAMAESSREVGAAQQQMEQKITVTGSSVDRLKARFIEGERAARDMAKTVDQVSRGFASGRISAQEAEQVLQGVVRTYGRTIDASAAVARGQAELAAAAANVNTAFRQQQVAAETERLERSAASLRAEIDPLGASQLQLNSKLAEYRTLLASGVISTNEFAKAQAAAQAKHDAFAKSLSGNHGVNTMGATMAAYQFQDIATQAVGGASIGTIALQQGPQLAMSLGEGGATGAVKTLGAGLAALVSPANLVAIGLTAAGAAAIQYFTSARGAAKSVEDVLKDHEKAIKGISDAYGGALINLKAYSDESRAFALLQSNSSQVQVQAQLRVSQSEFLQQFGAERSGRAAGRFGQTTTGTQFTANSEFKAFETAFQQLQSDIRAGKDGMDQFYRSVLAISETNPKLQKLADTILAASGNINQLTRAAEAAKRAMDLLFNDRGPNGMLLSRGTSAQADENAAGIYASRQAMDLKRMQQSYQAQIAELNARSPAEKAAAARANAAAQYNDQESPEIRRTRIELAGKQAQLFAEKQIADAQRDRQISLDAEIESAQQQISLIGKTGGELVALQKRYELIAALKQEAARNGTQVDEKEIELIKQKTAELGRLADQQARARFSYDMGEQWKSFGRTSQENQIASTLKQYGLPDNLNSPEAGRIKALLDAQQMKSDIHDFVSGFGQELVNSGGDIGKAFGQSIARALENQANRLWDRLGDMLGTILTRAITGGEASGATGIGGLLGKVISGGVANDNTPTGSLAPVIPVTRAPLGNIPATDVASYIAKGAVARGMDPEIALAVAKSEGGLKSWNMQSTVFKNGVQEPSFGPYQLYMNGGLGNAFMRKTGLDPRLAANGPAGVDFALDYAKQNGWSSWYGAGKAGIGRWDGINAGGAKTAADAVERLGRSATDATGGLTTLGGGLSKMGQTLSTSFFPSAPTGGGGGGILSSIFGGFKPFGAQASLAASGKITGLFADGTDFAPGGLAIVGERGAELVNLPRGSQVIPNHRIAQAVSSPAPSGPNILHVNIDGANGDNHVRMLVQQGVSEALAAHNETQRRGGVGAMQVRYANQKG